MGFPPWVVTCNLASGLTAVTYGHQRGSWVWPAAPPVPCDLLSVPPTQSFVAFGFSASAPKMRLLETWIWAKSPCVCSRPLSLPVLVLGWFAEMIRRCLRPGRAVPCDLWFGTQRRRRLHAAQQPAGGACSQTEATWASPVTVARTLCPLSLS